MTNETNVDVRLSGRNRFWQKLLGGSRWQIVISAGNWSTKAEGQTVEGTWTAAREMARIMLGVTIQEECPFDDKGKHRSSDDE